MLEKIIVRMNFLQLCSFMMKLILVGDQALTVGCLAAFSYFAVGLAVAQILAMADKPQILVVAADKLQILDDNLADCQMAVAERPEMAVAERPEIAVDERPEIAVDERPEIAVDERPEIAVDERAEMTDDKDNRLAVAAGNNHRLTEEMAGILLKTLKIYDQYMLTDVKSVDEGQPVVNVKLQQQMKEVMRAIFSEQEIPCQTKQITIFPIFRIFPILPYWPICLYLLLGPLAHLVSLVGLIREQD